MKALIVGAGIGGLATALALHRQGWQVAVRERSAALPEHGTALLVWPKALQVYRRLGLVEELMAAGQTVGDSRILLPGGELLLRTSAARNLQLIARPRLLRLLASALPQRCLSFDAPLTEAAELSGYDLVVGADGVNSSVRRIKWPEPHRTPSPIGRLVWRGAVAAERFDSSETWGPGSLFGITPREAGLTNWFACIALPQSRIDALLSDSTPEQRWALLAENFGHWHRDVQRVLDAGRDREFLFHQLEVLPPLGSFVNGRTALIGDAAHAMAPFLGRGACEAILDGEALARSLAAAGSLDEGLRQYDRSRRRAAQNVARASSAMGRIAMARHGLPLRNAALRSASALTRRRSRS